MAVSNMHKNLVKFNHAVFKLCKRSDRDRLTDRQTDSSQYIAWG